MNSYYTSVAWNSLEEQSQYDFWDLARLGKLRRYDPRVSGAYLETSMEVIVDGGSPVASGVSGNEVESHDWCQREVSKMMWSSFVLVIQRPLGSASVLGFRTEVWSGFIWLGQGGVGCMVRVV